MSNLKSKPNFEAQDDEAPDLAENSAVGPYEQVYKLNLGDGFTLTAREVDPSKPADSKLAVSDESIESAKEEEENNRATWGGKLEFLLTCVGYAVGLGNVWRFPYLCYKNGGGAFLVPYTIMMAVVGLPLFYMEVGLGQYSSLGPISVWKINPMFKGLGFASVIVCWIIALYYNVVIAHVLFYLYSSFTSTLPWSNCDNKWNTEHCLPYDAESSHLSPKTNLTYHINETTYNSSDIINTTVSAVSSLLHNATTKTPSEEYYRNYVLGQTDTIDDMGGFQWHLALCLLIAWVIVGGVLLKGIQSLGKVVYFTAIFPYVMLFILLIRGVTLPGAGKGIIYYLKPDFMRLTDPRVWSDAATQIFYSIGACNGGLIAMASYNKFKNNCYRDSIIVVCINCGTSILAGFVIFAVLGFMAFEKGVEVEDVASGGPGLAFIVYPEALVRMPISPLWSVSFFIMMATLGFGSEFSLVECVLSGFSDEFEILKSPRNNIIFRITACAITCLLALPMVCGGGILLLNLVDYSVGGFPLLVVGLMELVAVSWIYGYERFCENLCTMHGIKPNKYWKIMWKFVSPAVISLTVLMNFIKFKEPDMEGKPYPHWAISLGWLIAMTPIIAIISWAFFVFCRAGAYKVLKDAVQPLPSWGPANVSKQEYVYPEKLVRLNTGTPSNRGGRVDGSYAHLLGSNLSTCTTATDVSSFPSSR